MLYMLYSTVFPPIDSHWYFVISLRVLSGCFASDRAWLTHILARFLGRVNAWLQFSWTTVITHSTICDHILLTVELKNCNRPDIPPFFVVRAIHRWITHGGSLYVTPTAVGLHWITLDYTVDHSPCACNTSLVQFVCDAYWHVLSYESIRNAGTITLYAFIIESCHSMWSCHHREINA